MDSALVDAVVESPRASGLPALPPIPPDLRARVAAELAAASRRRDAYVQLDPGRPRSDWSAALAALEAEAAIWSITSALWHPSPDVQLEALAGLERLRDPRVVPALLAYAEAMAVPVSGSENATLHGKVHTALTRTLSALTGVAVQISGQNPARLHDAVDRWRREFAANATADVPAPDPRPPDGGR